MYNMDFTNFSSDSASTIAEESSLSSNDSSLEVNAYVSVSTDNEELAGLFNELMDKETVTPECCMETVDISFCGCDESVTFDAGELEVCSSGSILKVDLTLHDVCPDKRVALAVVLTEVDYRGKEHSRGMKTLTVPAHHHKCSDDIKVSSLRFVLPDDLNIGKKVYIEEKDKCKDKCKKRYFKARIMTNYVDNNFLCCGITM